MFALDTKSAMNMGATHAKNLNASMGMAYDDVLGIVTAASFKNKDKPDTSTIADNPPVAGSAGASDPNIAGVVRGIRARLLPLGSADRTTKESGMMDANKADPDGTKPQFSGGINARIRARMK
jgi:hypothetical protein